MPEVDDDEHVRAVHRQEDPLAPDELADLAMVVLEQPQQRGRGAHGQVPPGDLVAGAELDDLPSLAADSQTDDDGAQDTGPAAEPLPGAFSHVASL